MSQQSLPQASADGRDEGASFSCRIRDVEGLAAVLELVAAEFNKEYVRLQFHRGRGLQIQVIDQSQSSFLDAFFEADGTESIFTSFSCSNKHHSIWVDPGICAKAFRTAGGSGLLSSKARLHTNVHLSLADSGDKVEREFESVAASGIRRRCRHSISLYDPTVQGDEAEIDPADFTFTAEVLTDTPGMLQEVVTQLKAMGAEELRLEVDQQSVTFTSTSSGRMNEASLRLFQSDGDGRLAISCDKEFCASFAFRYFIRLAKLCKASSRLLLQTAADSPLSALVDLIGGGSCQLFLAPLLDKVEGEEDPASKSAVSQQADD